MIKGFELNDTVDAKVKICCIVTNQSHKTFLNQAIEQACDMILEESQDEIMRMLNINKKKRK